MSKAIIKEYKPTTPARRGMSTLKRHLTVKGAFKGLLKTIKKSTGRNNRGVITSRFRGGGAKRQYRIIDFKRLKFGIPARIETIEYDPYRGASISLISYLDGEKTYILSPEGIEVGDRVVSGERVAIKPGNRMQLRHIPLGMSIYNIELRSGQGGKIVRSAGTSAVLSSKHGGFALLKLPSGEIRKVPENCLASIGSLSNAETKNVSIGKAGRKRHLGRRPHVLGKSMNPVDHPHGGGEGHTSIGLKKGPKTPWGKPALGLKTRHRKKASSRLIVRSRHAKKRR